MVRGRHSCPFLPRPDRQPRRRRCDVHTQCVSVLAQPLRQFPDTAAAARDAELQLAERNGIMLVGAPENVADAEITYIPPADDYGVRAVECCGNIDWSSHERDELVGGRRLHYVDIGSGDHTVVLVHGFSASWRVWTDVIPALARQYRVIA